MASVLPPPPSVTLPDRSFAEPLCFRSRASIESQPPTGTTLHTRRRSPSVACPLPVHANGLASQTVPNHVRNFDQASGTSPNRGKALLLDNLAREEENQRGLCCLAAPEIKRSQDSQDSVVPFPPLEPIANENADRGEMCDQTSDPRSEEQDVESSSPFKRWLKTLRARHNAVGPQSTSRWPDHCNPAKSEHRRTLSLSSSIGMLSAVKSAALTYAGTSIVPASMYGRQSHFQNDTASISFRGLRLSVDKSSPPMEPTIDSKAWYRSMQRWNIVEEIVQSEEGYISDMKAMVHVLGGILQLRCAQLTCPDLLHASSFHPFVISTEEGIHPEVHWPDHSVT